MTMIISQQPGSMSPSTVRQDSPLRETQNIANLIFYGFLNFTAETAVATAAPFTYTNFELEPLQGESKGMDAQPPLNDQLLSSFGELWQMKLLHSVQ